MNTIFSYIFQVNSKITVLHLVLLLYELKHCSSAYLYQWGLFKIFENNDNFIYSRDLE